MNIRIVLVDDHTVVREALRVLLGRHSNLEVIDVVGNGRAAKRVVCKKKPDLVIIDYMMPELNGIDATRQMKRELPNLKIICLSMHSDRELVAGMLEAGATGYLLKDCEPSELIRAIRAVMANQTYISPAVAGNFVDYYRGGWGTRSSSASALTPREREVLQLIAEGYSTKEIADRLHLSVKTIGTHREHMMTKLSISSVAGLTRYAIQHGICLVGPQTNTLKK